MAFINVHVNCAVDRGCCPATGQPEKPVTVVVFVRHRVLFPTMAASLLVVSFFPRAREQCLCVVFLPAMAGCRRHARFCNGVVFVVLFFLILLHFSVPVSARRLLFYSGWQGYTLPSLYFLAPGARSFIVDINILICARSLFAENQHFDIGFRIFWKKVLWRR